MPTLSPDCEIRALSPNLKPAPGYRMGCVILVKPSKAESKAWQERLSIRQTPNEMKQTLREISGRLHVRVLINSGLGFYRDAWAACAFAEARGARSVRLLWPAERPDFEIESELGLQQFETVEADKPGRKRGDEYKAILPRLDAEEQVVEDVPDEDWMTPEQASEMLGRAAQSKADDRYAADCNLLILLNHEDFVGDHDVIISCMAQSTSVACDRFAEVWVLWKGVAHLVWRAGSRASTASC